MGWYKAEATGNDFILWVSDRAEAQAEHGSPTKDDDVNELRRAVAEICDRRFGVGADGLIVLRGAQQRWSWQFYNSDGSDAEMCGNATRAVGCLLHHLHLAQEAQSIELTTSAGPVQVSSVHRDQSTNGTKHWRTVLSYLKAQIQVATELPPMPRGVRGVWYANTGVPHLVLEVDSIEAGKQDIALIRGLRQPNAARPGGANVTLLTPEHQTVTYERGVEDWTLSCGTGALAAGLVALKREGRMHDGEALRLVAPGGELNVELTKGMSMALSGPARIVAGLQPSTPDQWDRVTRKRIILV